MQVLHEHYVDTFEHIRDRERTRDKLFVFYVCLLGSVVVFLKYPSISSNFNCSSTSDFILIISKLPLNVFISIAWTGLALTTIRYLQNCLLIERQYTYLHGLEDYISKSFFSSKIFKREGKSYISNLPLFNNFVWMFYVVVVPLLSCAIVAIVFLEEWHSQSVPDHNVWLDGILAITIIASFFFSRLLVLFQSLINKIRK